MAGPSLKRRFLPLSLSCLILASALPPFSDPSVSTRPDNSPDFWHVLASISSVIDLGSLFCPRAAQGQNSWEAIPTVPSPLLTQGRHQVSEDRPAAPSLWLPCGFQGRGDGRSTWGERASPWSRGLQEELIWMVWSWVESGPPAGAESFKGLWRLCERFPDLPQNNNRQPPSPQSQMDTLCLPLVSFDFHICPLHWPRRCYTAHRSPY